MAMVSEHRALYGPIDVRGDGNWAGQLLPMATTELTIANRAHPPSSFGGERAAGCGGCS